MVEYSPLLLRSLSGQAQRRSVRGMLLGAKKGNRIEVHGFHGSGDQNLDTRYPAVGIYVVRARGEVFLTEADLAFLEQSGLPIALVIAGGRGGFFFWEPDRAGAGIDSRRSIQSIKSYQEFSTAGQATAREPRRIADILRRALFASIP